MDELSVLESVEAGQAPASAARSVKDIPLGITRGMASDDYHAERSAVSSSQLKRMLVSPAHFMCGLNETEESTEAMLFGTVLHGRDFARADDRWAAAFATRGENDDVAHSEQVVGRLRAEIRAIGNTRIVIGDLGVKRLQQPRHDRRAQAVQLMRDAMVQDRQRAGIGNQDLVRRGIDLF